MEHFRQPADWELHGSPLQHLLAISLEHCQLEQRLNQHYQIQNLASGNDNLDKDLKLADIAEAVGWSQYYFARLFKQSLGVTPHQYVIQQRMERAKQLLTVSRFPVAEVAYRVGFSKQSHFTAQFRKVTGTTPKGYREDFCPYTIIGIEPRIL